MTMPVQKPGLSRQDYQTPPEFLNAVQWRLQDNLTFDLAASEETTVECLPYFDEDDDSLSQAWTDRRGGWLWCNPPYGDIAPWVHKAADESLNGCLIAMLVPASVGANWWREYVDGQAYILFLNGRIRFVGTDGPYPKDLALLLYTPFIRSGSAIWNWRETISPFGTGEAIAQSV